MERGCRAFSGWGGARLEARKKLTVEQQAAEAVELAESILSEAGVEERLKGIPQKVKARVGKEKDIITDDVWIMRRR